MAPQQVWALGDLQYNSGSLSDFTVSHQNSWGRFKAITKPVVGNHEYGTGGAAGYYTYFGDLASPRQPGCTRDCEGYYSFDVAVGSAQWHVAVINSECTRIGGGVGCAVGTGGRDSQGFGTVVSNSQVRKIQIFGVMKLTLRPAGYDWQFVPDPATPFVDSGTGSCN